MALKNLSVLDSNVGSYSEEAEPDNQPGLITQIFGDALFDEPCLTFLDDQNYRPIQTERPQDDDYEVALLPRRNRTRRAGPILQSSTTMDLVFLLPITWRELLDRVRRELSHSSPV